MWLKSILFACPLLLIGLGVADSRAETASKPNIIFILADDLGYGDVSCLNSQRGRIPTPHIDRLAREGITFTDAHSGSSVCTPTRYGLLTGRYAWRTRLQKGVLDGGSEEPLISADRLTLPAMLRQQGYSTACIGKWHLGLKASAPFERPKKVKGMPVGFPLGTRFIGGPTERGFDYFWGCSNARTMASLIENDRVVELLPPVEMLPRLTRRAVEVLGERATDAKLGRPFFLYVALTSPHLPILPAAAWKGRSPLGGYADFVMQTDDSVGEILASLERLGLVDNTLVVFASDNGCSVEADVQKLEAQEHNPSARFRGYKTDIWEGGHRIPFFARWPGHVKPASTSDAIICLGDFMATTARLLDVHLPAAAAPDSMSFLSSLLGDAHAVGRTDIVHHSALGIFAIRSGRWKLIFGGGSGGVSHPTDAEALANGWPDAQLYDLEADPGESKNRVLSHRSEAGRLVAQLARYVARGRSTPGPDQANDVDVQLPALTSVNPQ